MKNVRLFAHPNVWQWKYGPSVCSSLRHTDRMWSEYVTGELSLTKTNVLPSTGDLTIPTMCRSCCHGDMAFNLTAPKRATHSALLWLKTKINNFKTG